MTFENQPILQFLLLTGLGLAGILVGLVLVTDYKGFTTRYARRLKKSYQHPLYQKVFVWGEGQRRRTSDERLIRRWVRIPSVGFVFIGLIILAGEVGALATGHVV